MLKLLRYYYKCAFSGLELHVSHITGAILSAFNCDLGKERSGEGQNSLGVVGKEKKREKTKLHMCNPWLEENKSTDQSQSFPPVVANKSQ